MHMKSFLIVILIIFTSIARSAFYNSDQLPNKPQKLKNAINSTFYLNVDASDNHCTAFAISNNGYVLTNLHCLRSCFANGSEYYSADYYKKTEDLGVFDLWEVKSNYPKNQICRNYTSFDNNKYFTEPQIVTLGAGKGSFEEKELSQIPKAIFNKIIKVSEDYAILKYDQVIAEPCIKISKAVKIQNENLWLIGYPKKSDRHDGFDSDGLHQYVSTGFRRKSIKEDPYLKSIFSKNKEWNLESSMYDQKRFILSDLDVLGGNSGGPIINSEGELVALLFAKVISNTDKQEQTTAIGLRADEIYKSVLKKLGHKKTSEIFNCREVL